MKKINFALAVLLTTAFCTQATVYAEDDIPLLSEEEVLTEEVPTSDIPPLSDSGVDGFRSNPIFSIPPTGELSSECGTNGNMTFYLYVSEENKNQVTRIVFYDKNTGDEYFYKFNPVNYDDDKLWVQHINIPQGDYFVSCRVSGDTYGRYSCSLYPKGELHIGNMIKSVVCLVGPKDWMEDAYKGMEKAESQINATPTPIPTLEPEVTLAPVPTSEPLEEIEHIPEEIPEEPKEKNNVPFYVFIGFLVVATVFLNTKKKKKK